MAEVTYPRILDFIGLTDELGYVWLNAAPEKHELSPLSSLTCPGHAARSVAAFTPLARVTMPALLNLPAGRGWFVT
jgi:hypothetical protein